MKTLLGGFAILFSCAALGCGGDDSSSGNAGDTGGAGSGGTGGTTGDGAVIGGTGGDGGGSATLQKLVPTEQTACYNNSEEIPCPTSPCNADGSPDFCGQDAQYPDNPRNFIESTVDGDVIVTDSLTGLVWQKTYVTEKTPQEAIDYCDALTYAGQTDWRLPTVEELASLVSYGMDSPASNFPGMTSDWFWSSLSNAEDASEEWCVDFSVGYVDVSNKVNVAAARCVRGEPYFSNIEDRFHVTGAAGQQTVLDQVTGLSWQQEYVTEKTWQQALSYCEALSYGGYSDWRLPDVVELRSLVNYSKGHPASDFPNMPSEAFWSSSSIAVGARYAWRPCFFPSYDGYIGPGDKAYQEAVRCVRGGP